MDQLDQVGSPRAHGKASANWSFHPIALTKSSLTAFQLYIIKKAVPWKLRGTAFDFSISKNEQTKPYASTLFHN